MSKPLVNEMKDIREKMDEKRRANMEEFEKILTPEQKEKFEALKEKGRNERMRGPRGENKHFRHHGPKMGPRGAKFEAEETKAE